MSGWDAAWLHGRRLCQVTAWLAPCTSCVRQPSVPLRLDMHAGRCMDAGLAPDEPHRALHAPRLSKVKLVREHIPTQLAQEGGSTKEHEGDAWWCADKSQSRSCALTAGAWPGAATGRPRPTARPTPGPACKAAAHRRSQSRWHSGPTQHAAATTCEGARRYIQMAVTDRQTRLPRSDWRAHRSRARLVCAHLVRRRRALDCYRDDLLAAQQHKPEHAPLLPLQTWISSSMSSTRPRRSSFATEGIRASCSSQPRGEGAQTLPVQCSAAAQAPSSPPRRTCPSWGAAGGTPPCLPAPGSCGGQRP